MLSPSWGSQDPKRNRSPSASRACASPFQILRLTSIFWGALLLRCSTESFSLCLYRPSPRHFTHSAKAMGDLPSRQTFLGHIYKPQRIVNTADRRPGDCYLRPTRIRHVGLSARSYFVGRFATTKTRPLVGKGWMRLDLTVSFSRRPPKSRFNKGRGRPSLPNGP